MSQDGTTFYADLDQGLLPPLVKKAVAVAHDIGFELCVHPATGRLLQVLAAGVSPGGAIGETGTGTGAGLAWIASLADPSVSIISVELDEQRAAAAQEIFSEQANVTVIQGDAGDVFERGPFDLLVIDGGWGSGKGGSRLLDPREVLKPFGTMTVDDFAPMAMWPPSFAGEPDTPRIHWIEHEDMQTTEIQVAEDMAVLVGRRVN